MSPFLAVFTLWLWALVPAAVTLAALWAWQRGRGRRDSRAYRAGYADATRKYDAICADLIALADYQDRSGKYTAN